jgi:hypothetical protein
VNPTLRSTPAGIRLPIRWLASVVLSLLVAGCASSPTLRSEVVRFHAWQGAEPLSFAFRPTPQQAGSLEHRSYEQLVRERLLALGFSEADAAVARYRVVLDYRATPEPFRSTEYWPPVPMGPIPGVWGPGPWLGPRPYPPYGRYSPWWGVPPMPIVRESTVYRHQLRVDLLDARAAADAGRTVFESRASAIASIESMPRLMPGLVAAVFSEFPGENGSTRRVEVPLPQPVER